MPITWPFFMFIIRLDANRQPGREVTNDVEGRSANLDWMWHRHVVAVALRVPRNAGRLAVAAIVGGTRHDDVVARPSVPVEIPPGPGPRNVGLTNGRRLPPPRRPEIAVE